MKPDEWRVRYTPPGGKPKEAGGTGMPSEAFALGVYESWIEECRKNGGGVELLKNGQIVASFTAEAP